MLIHRSKPCITHDINQMMQLVIQTKIRFFW